MVRSAAYGPTGDFPRGTRPDGVAGDKILLVKNLKFLRLTYQLRLLAFIAVSQRMTLVLIVPSACRFSPALQALIEKNLKGVVVREPL